MTRSGRYHAQGPEGKTTVDRTPHDILGRVRKQRIRPIRREWILRFFDERPRGRVLDAPAGTLWLARALVARQYEVDALDRIDQEADASAAGIRYTRGDLDDGLSQFADRTFDYVVCVEGLEHLERPAFLLREFARVLKPRGLLLVTTPNIVSVRSRLKFLLFGYYDGFRRRALFRSLGTSTAHETPHITPLHVQFLYYWLTGAGFVHIRAHRLPVRRVEGLVLRPLATLVAGLGWAAGRANGDRHYTECLTLLTSLPVLLSPTLVLSAQRADSIADGGTP